MNNIKKIAKKLVPLFKRYEEIDEKFNSDLPVEEVKQLNCELADTFTEVINLCLKHSFPKDKGKIFLDTMKSIKVEVNDTQDETLLQGYTNYLLKQFKDLAAIIGV